MRGDSNWRRSTTRTRGLARALATVASGLAAWALASANPASGQWSGAQGARPPVPQAEARPPRCTPRPGQLGVSRLIEVDSTTGPRFGERYGTFDVLRDGEIMLTFDDGPMRRATSAVLDALAEHCTLATFFMVGRNALADPTMVREVAGRGHNVAVHTWSHENLARMAPPRARTEIELGLSAVQAALGAPPAPFFRFPYLADSETLMTYLAGRHVSVFGIDLDSQDFRFGAPREMQRTLLANLAQKRKAILLFHDTHAVTVKGIKDILDELAQRGFKVVHPVPRTRATSIASYDQMAMALSQRTQVVALAAPPRAAAWPMVPARPGSPAAAPVASGSWVPQLIVQPQLMMRPASAQVRALPGESSPPPALLHEPRLITRAAPPAAVPDLAPVPDTSTAGRAESPPADGAGRWAAPPAALRRAAEEDDWRERVFRN